MLQWHWTRRLFISVWIVIALSPNLVAYAEVPTSSGPRSTEEAQTLWTEGQEAILLNKTDDAIRLLSRLVDRYPGQAGFLDAQYWLGKMYLQASKPAKAIPPLRHYIEATQKDPQGIPLRTLQAKLLLARAWIAQKKLHEAYEVTVEIERNFSQSKSTDSNTQNLTQAEAMLLRSMTLFEMKKRTRSETAFEAIRPLLATAQVKGNEQDVSTDLRAEVANFALQLKLSHCSDFPSAKRLQEAQLKEQMERRASCLLEALNLFQGSLKTTISPHLENSVKQLSQAFALHVKLCKAPPSPAGVRSPEQLLTYHEELVQFLTRECSKTLQSALEFLKQWKTIYKLPRALQAIDQLSDGLKSLDSQLTENHS